MLSTHLPRFRLLPAANLDQTYQHAIVISLLRGLAALQVAAAHVRAQFFPGLAGLPDPSLWYQALAFVTGFAHQAVVIFFVLSGWLVGGSLLNKLREPGIMLSYTIDRFTRIWIVLIPAFVLTLALGVLIQQVDPARPSYAAENEFSATAFVGNLFGLMDMAVPRYGGNFALWSLANEIWYYALFPLLILTFAGKPRTTQVAALAIGVLVGYHLLGRIMLYFPVWLLGVAFSRIRVDASRASRWLLLAVFGAVAVYFRLTGSNDILVAESFVQDLAYSLLFLTLLSSLQYPADRTRLGTRLASAVGSRLAPYSFTLYVIHAPLLLALRQLHDPGGTVRLSPHDIRNLAVYAAMCAGLLLFAYLFHLPFEAQTNRMRAFIKRKLAGPLRYGRGQVQRKPM